MEYPLYYGVCFFVALFFTTTIKYCVHRYTEVLRGLDRQDLEKREENKRSKKQQQLKDLIKQTISEVEKDKKL